MTRTRVPVGGLLLMLLVPSAAGSSVALQFEMRYGDPRIGELKRRFPWADHAVTGKPRFDPAHAEGISDE